MRVVAVSPETIHHREAEDTRRIQGHLQGLANRGHDVVVCCARWWGDGGRAVPNGGAAAEPPDDGNTIAGDPEDEPTAATAETGPAVDDPEGMPDRPSETQSGLDEGAVPESGLEDGPVVEDDVSPGTDERTFTVDGITYRAVVDDLRQRRAFALRAPFEVRLADPDVIHAVGPDPAAVLGARAGATLARVPVVAEWYDPARVDADDWATRKAISSPSRLITPSRLTKRQLRERGADADRIRVLPTPVDVDRIHEVDPREDGDEIVYARRLDDDANLESLLLGLAELRGREWSATVVGDGPVRDDYERQVRDLRIDDRVTFAGACDRDERIAIYRNAHVFAQTARRCPFATELLWALACGCVGIVEYHADSSAHELVEGYDRGFRTTNPQETAQAVLDAGGLERRTTDEEFERFDEWDVLESYLDVYREAREDWGLLDAF